MGSKDKHSTFILINIARFSLCAVVVVCEGVCVCVFKISTMCGEEHPLSLPVCFRSFFPCLLSDKLDLLQIQPS